MRTTKTDRLHGGQSDLSLHWAHMSEGTCSQNEAHMDVDVYLHFIVRH